MTPEGQVRGSVGAVLGLGRRHQGALRAIRRDEAHKDQKEEFRAKRKHFLAVCSMRLKVDGYFLAQFSSSYFE